MLDAPHENTHEEAADLALERRDRVGCRGLYLDGDHDRRVASDEDGRGNLALIPML